MLEEKTQDLMVNMQAVLPLIVTNALNALGAIVILLIGLWLSERPISSWSERSAERRISTPCCAAFSAASRAI
jgi:hypothetical protein